MRDPGRAGELRRTAAAMDEMLRALQQEQAQIYQAAAALRAATDGVRREIAELEDEVAAAYSAPSAL